MTKEQAPAITDLPQFVTDLLQKAGHPNPNAWLAFLTPDALTSTDLTVQRFLVNRAWRVMLAKVTEEDTMDIRFCLVDDGKISDWARLFENNLLPCIMKYNLPRQ